MIDRFLSGLRSFSHVFSRKEPGDLSKENLKKILQELVVEEASKQKLTVNFLFDNDSVVVKRGERIQAQYSFDERTIIFYLENIYQSFKSKDDKFEDYIRPIIVEKLFELSIKNNLTN